MALYVATPNLQPQAAIGPVAEWPCRGLQILVRRFDSGPGLHGIPAQKKFLPEINTGLDAPYPGGDRVLGDALFRNCRPDSFMQVRQTPLGR